MPLDLLKQRVIYPSNFFQPRNKKKTGTVAHTFERDLEGLVPSPLYSRYLPAGQKVVNV
jgi:hypothetical protein